MRIMLTGFPGFIGRRIIRELARNDEENSFVLLIEERLRGVAARYLREDGIDDHCELVPGDITRHGCGLTDVGVLRDVDQVWHLAALYDLAAPREVSERVNVLGTDNVLSLCEQASSLERLIYFSTCYVAGNRTGRIFEHELDMGQGFRNHYEATKFRAEQRVRDRMDRVPATILRPAVVVGDSRTGETDKYDGPYPMIRTLLRQPGSLGMPKFGKGRATINVVPVDYVASAAIALAGRAEAIGQTCHLADPDPMTTDELMEEVHRIVNKRPLPVRIPGWVASNAMRARAVRKFVGLPRESMDYIDDVVMFDTTAARRLLAGSRVSCPPIREYLPVLVDYVRSHPKKSFLDDRHL